jgi:AhpC/TSA family
MLVEFWDFARINSIRTMPYLKAWYNRYRDDGLEIAAVHSPGYSFGRDQDVIARAVQNLEIGYPVALDAEFEIWRLYGNKGWPARYLFDSSGVLRYFHYGEGDYGETELAIQELLLETEPGLCLPEPMPYLRPEEQPGAKLIPQTQDLAFPSDRSRVQLVRDWVDGEDFIEALDAGAGALTTFTGAACFAVLSGSVAPGIYETDGRVVANSPGLRLHGFQFTPALFESPSEA